ncbi:MAG: hypothetical protein V1862_14240 [Methanobacteriota archaeon]
MQPKSRICRIIAYSYSVKGDLRGSTGYFLTGWMMTIVGGHIVNARRHSESHPVRKTAWVSCPPGYGGRRTACRTPCDISMLYETADKTRGKNRSNRI